MIIQKTREVSYGNSKECNNKENNGSKEDNYGKKDNEVNMKESYFDGGTIGYDPVVPP